MHKRENASITNNNNNDDDDDNEDDEREGGREGERERAQSVFYI